ncbi:MAG: hypothetical protein ACRBEE_05890 [Arenicella sp.]
MTQVYNTDQVNEIVREIGDKIDYDTTPERMRDAIALLSDTNFLNDANLSKLTNIEGTNYRGHFASLAAITATTPVSGNFATYDSGTGNDAKLAIYDASDNQWVQVGANPLDPELARAQSVITASLDGSVANQFNVGFDLITVPVNAEVLLKFDTATAVLPNIKFGTFATIYPVKGVSEINIDTVYRAVIDGGSIYLKVNDPLVTFTPADWLSQQDDTSPATPARHKGLNGSILEDTNAIHVSGLFVPPIDQALSLRLLMAPTTPITGKNKNITFQVVDSEGSQIGSDKLFEDFDLSADDLHHDRLFENVLTATDITTKKRVRFVIIVDEATNHNHTGNIHIAQVEVV